MTPVLPPSRGLRLAILVARASWRCAARHELMDVPGQGCGERVGGQQTGPWTDFSAEGSISAQGRYVDDEQHGSWSDCFAPGADGRAVREFEIDFEEGHLHGAYRRWFRSGDSQAEGFFESDAEQGPWTFLAPGGRAAGSWVTWDAAGQFTAAGELDGSRLIGDWIVVAEGQPQSWSSSVFEPPRPPHGQWSPGDLAKALDIRARQALPTTILLDEQGLVRWAHVGKDKVDRPDVERLIGEFERMSGR